MSDFNKRLVRGAAIGGSPVSGICVVRASVLVGPVGIILEQLLGAGPRLQLGVPWSPVLASVAVPPRTEKV